MLQKSFTLLFAGVCFATASASRADEPPAKACRSVHLGYSAPAGSAFYVEANVKQSVEGTYFCAAGFNTGYFGIQELTRGRKVVIFSIWDPTTGDNPQKVPVEKRVKVLYEGEGVRTGRFGGEGTGGQSFYNYDWKPGQTYRFYVTAGTDESDKDRVAYTAYFFLPETKQWKRLATFSTIAKSKQLDGYYSFVEDFRRNTISATKIHEAEYGNVWIRNVKGEWISATKATFTGDSSKNTNIDAGLTKSTDRFFLKTGGSTENHTTKLNAKIELPASIKAMKPTDLPTP
ncbi:MAG: DUF3472 domain-containing protein [Gemmataceae bacterium]